MLSNGVNSLNDMYLEKLVIHNRSCTADNPARRVKDPVNRGLPKPKILQVSDEPALSSSQVQAGGIDSPASLAGAPGRSMRHKRQLKPDQSHPTEISSQVNPPSLEKSLEGTLSRDVVVVMLRQRLVLLEESSLQIIRTIEEMRSTIDSLT